MDQWIVAIATVITAGATIAYVLVATGQLKAIRRQADAAAQQLRAMDRQADIAEGNVTSLERPWILVTVDPPQPWRPEKQNLPYPRPIAAMVNATNCGRTPAFILRRSYALRVFPEGLPVEPPYPEEFVFNSGPGITGLGVAVNERHSEPTGFEITEDEMRRERPRWRASGRSSTATSGRGTMSPGFWSHGQSSIRLNHSEWA